MDPAVLEANIGYRFADSELLTRALTHRSYSNEQTIPSQHNERLEFLGDAVLDLVIGERLYLDFPELPEGELTRLRAEVVNERVLADAARAVGLGDSLLLGRGEDRSGGRTKESLLANALEALIGAVFRDGGWESARLVTERLLEAHLAEAVACKGGRDYKTRLQEYLQTTRGCLPNYLLAGSTGPDHERVFHVEVRIGSVVLGCGEGRSKKAAEQEAASQALARLKTDVSAP